ncbi:hypothetical protein GHT06_007677 [Daphnia sinensis]|uniref:Uncharacterized protein n=1 Tax=Daphnia sinensis TaxID=1820382 RepID=A0AAD5LHZ0_9CRUS|nr:hypothetical protein GHT06_010112 [Daphnia sinensis]KAI9563940.1 hypothetical protein GHT06_007677 [Daphnia sinensis]
MNKKCGCDPGLHVHSRKLPSHEHRGCDPHLACGCQQPRPLWLRYKHCDTHSVTGAGLMTRWETAIYEGRGIHDERLEFTKQLSQVFTKDEVTEDASP